jgi:hypothetical protein
VKIGIISDTHDNIPKIKEAVSTFNLKGVDFVIHAGDYVAPFSIAPLEKLKCDYAGVFGNNDGEKAGLTKKSGEKIKAQPFLVEFDGKKILILHEPNNLDALTETQIYDIIIYGHTHNPVIEKQGKTLIINPGECCGWLTGKSTIALVDLNDMSAKIIKVI